MNELFFDSTWQPLLDTLLSGVRGLLDLSQNGFFHLQAQGGDTTGGFDIFSNGLLDKDTFDYMLELKRMITAGDRTGLVGAMAYYAKVIAGFLCLAHFAGKAYNYMLGE